MKRIITTITITAAAIAALPASAQDMIHKMDPAKTARAYDLNPNEFRASGKLLWSEPATKAIEAEDRMGNFEIQDLKASAKADVELIKDREVADKLGNFEIQDLMSSYNQSEQLSSSVQKKRDDTESAVISKVG